MKIKFQQKISSTTKIETKDKWNQIHLLSMDSILGANCRISLVHISNRKIYIEETNERINEFSFAYMLNPHLKTNKAFKNHVKTCLSNTFGADTNRHINKTLVNQYTRVLALVVFMSFGLSIQEKCSKC